MQDDDNLILSLTPDSNSGIKYISLEKDEKQSRKRMREDEEEGVCKDDYVCPLCTWGDSGVTENTTREMEYINEIYEKYFKKVPDEYLWWMIAEYYNNYIISPQLAIHVEPKPEYISKIQVRFHFTNCDIRNPAFHIWSDIEFCIDAQKALQRNGIFMSGPDGATRLDYKQTKCWVEFSKRKSQLLIMAHQFQGDMNLKTKVTKTQNLGKGLSSKIT